MKNLNIALLSLAVLAGAASCEDKLDVSNTNVQTSDIFGATSNELDEAVIACYHHARLEGTFARVGYTLDAVRGDEVWNSSQTWYLPYDNLNVVSSDDIGCQWIWRDWYMVINAANYVLKQLETATVSDEQRKIYEGQGKFFRGYGYYILASYYQTAPIYTDYNDYNSLESNYKANSSQDELLNQAESDLSDAMKLLPSRDKGGEWAGGRATSGAAAAAYSQVLMFRQKYAEALPVLKDIISGTKYGSYALVRDYGDNCREGLGYENNSESVFEIQYLDFGQGGTVDEWTPVNISANSTQKHAVESNYAPGMCGGWGDLAASPWLYNLFKSEKTVSGELDPRLYWTLGTYEKEYVDYTGSKTTDYAKYAGVEDPRCNVMYKADMSDVLVKNADGTIKAQVVVTHAVNGGIPIVKNTNARNGLYESVTVGLKCGVNLRIIRYADVLLRAAECENEVNGPAGAVEYINQIRERACLEKLENSIYKNALESKDAMFEYIANVERPREFGCEFGRGTDLIRWGFFYDKDRFNQISQHSAFVKNGTPEKTSDITKEVTTATADDYSYKYYAAGHEYFPISQGELTKNPNLKGNSANTETSTDNSSDFASKGYKVHPVVDLLD